MWFTEKSSNPLPLRKIDIPKQRQLPIPANGTPPTSTDASDRDGATSDQQGLTIGLVLAVVVLVLSGICHITLFLDTFLIINLGLFLF